MAVALEFINLLVRIDAIEARWSGGWTSFRIEHEKQIGAAAWYDDHLFRTGAMSPGDMLGVVEDFEARGLQLARREGGEPVEGIDGCVVIFLGPTLSCKWIAFTDGGEAAYLRGHEPGRVMRRGDFPEFDWAEYYRTH